MSWEEMSKKEVKCPCKKGVVTLTTYGDDWNRTKDEAKIECFECRMKYEILKKTHNGLLQTDGDKAEYFLLSKDYPKSEHAFSKIVNLHREMPFYVYLIRKYSKSDLADILDEYESITRVKDLRGIYSRVAKDSKERTGSAVRETIIANLKKALELYDGDENNFERHEIVENERRAKHDEYLKERDKHLIKLDF